MNIKDLSISDLKAAYDFVLIDIKDLENSAEQKGINPNEIPAYKEVKQLEDQLYNQLLNLTRILK